MEDMAPPEHVGHAANSSTTKGQLAHWATTNRFTNVSTWLKVTYHLFLSFLNFSFGFFLIY